MTDTGELLQLALTQMDHPCFIKDKEGRYLFGNPKGAALAGESVEKLLGLTDKEIFGEEIGEKYRQKDLALMRGEKINPIDVFTDVHGTTRVYYIIRQSLRNEQDEVIGVFGIRVDLTDYLHEITQKEFNK